jgi:hypothetical protein
MAFLAPGRDYITKIVLTVRLSLTVSNYQPGFPFFVACGREKKRSFKLRTGFSNKK